MAHSRRVQDLHLGWQILFNDLQQRSLAIGEAGPQAGMSLDQK